jgi:hypothetical protein
LESQKQSSTLSSCASELVGSLSYLFVWEINPSLKSTACISRTHQCWDAKWGVSIVSLPVGMPSWGLQVCVFLPYPVLETVQNKTCKNMMSWFFLDTYIIESKKYLMKGMTPRQICTNTFCTSIKFPSFCTSNGYYLQR